MTEEEGQRAWREAQRMLGRRALTRGELLRRLEDKGLPSDACREAAERAAADRYLDDGSVAARMVERLVLEKAYGKRRAAEEMKRRLLEPDEIRRALEDLEAENPEAEQQALGRSSARWVARHGPPTDEASRNRLALHLKSRGFPDSLIRREILDRRGSC